jgi:hypothetical protein
VGYTTDFEGSFRCYLPENAKVGSFLKAIHLGDKAAIFALADWLTDLGDPRGPQIAALRDVEVLSAGFWQLFGLRPEHAAYLRAFSDTRQMKRNGTRARQLPDPVRKAAGLPLGREAAYFVGGRGFAGQDPDDSIIDQNEPPRGQPGLWCHWAPTEDGTAIAWNGAEKFYSYVEWLEYLILHFLTRWGYVLNGRVDWQGEEDSDQGTILVRENVVETGPLLA